MNNKVEETYRDFSEGPEMVVVPKGSFEMGTKGGGFFSSTDNSETPQHSVYIDYVLAIGKYPVTFDEFDAYLRETRRSIHLMTTSELSKDMGWGRGSRPAICVPWTEAQHYVRWLCMKTGKPYRLLSEAEWEYACRAGDVGKWCFGDRAETLSDYAWFRENLAVAGEPKTMPVGAKKPNAFGLHDMHGNVFEYVEDLWHDNYNGAPTNGCAWTKNGDSNYIVVRGGYSGSPLDATRSAARKQESVNCTGNYIGFRVAYTIS